MTTPDERPTDETPESPAPTNAAPPPSPVQPKGDGPRTLDVIMDLDLPLTVRFGQTMMTLGALSRLAPGSEISLDRAPNDPVELLINGKVIARGDVVAVDGNYAVQITDVVSPAERMVKVGD